MLSTAWHIRDPKRPAFNSPHPRALSEAGGGRHINIIIIKGMYIMVREKKRRKQLMGVGSGGANRLGKEEELAEALYGHVRDN